MWSTKTKPVGTDVELEALRSEEYNAHPRQRSSIGSSDTILRSKHPQWKLSIRYCALAGGFVFLLNSILLLYGEGRAGFPILSSNDGKRTVYDGDCNTTKRINVGIHLVINILSTILLGASNYCMQCMSAPTRAEAEQAHARFRWVDVGIPSVRNLRMIRRLRVLLWILLAASSLPLHLFYNSTVFASITANEYMIFSVNEGFLDPSAQNFTRIDIGVNSEINVINHMFDLHQAGKLERLSVADCISAYAQNYQSARGNLLLVVSNETDALTTDEFTHGAVADYETQVAPVTSLDDSDPAPYGWICGKELVDYSVSCASAVAQLQRSIANGAKWQPFKRTIQSCMSEPMVQHCRVQYSAPLLLVVVMIGLLKTAVMLYIAFGVQDVPLLTIGDAVSSFLAKPESRTLGMCLLDKSLKQFKPSSTRVQRTSSGRYDSLGWTVPPISFRQGRRRQCAAASVRRWASFLLTFGILLTASILLFQYGVYWYKDGTVPYGRKINWAQGLGTVDPRGFISWSLPTSGPTALVSNVMVANTPQLLLSFLYLNYNGIVTVMSLAREASRYGIRRNGLRVSGTPRGAQRSTYFLQLPYRFAIPIIAVTGVLHWLISQGIFLVNIEAIMLLDATVARPDDTQIWATDLPRYLITCCYSPLAILASIFVVCSLFIGILVMGCIKLPSSVPLAASCSAAIAAACHAPIEEIDESITEKKFMWGKTGEDENGIGHCAYSTKEVEQPQDGKLYA